MKKNTMIVSLFLFNLMSFGFAVDQVNEVITVTVPEIVVVQPVRKCTCGPTEHWFYKTTVNKYIAKHSDSGLLENNDIEGLPGNVVAAIDMLAGDIKFIDDNGIAIVPELNAKGNLYLPMSRNSDYKLCKEILRHVDIETTLTAQELYQKWSETLIAMRSPK